MTKALTVILFIYLAVVLTFVALSSDLFIYLFEDVFRVGIPWPPN